MSADKGDDYINKIDFRDGNIFRRLEMQAYDGTITLDDFPAAEYRYFDRLRIIYARFRYNHLSKQDAEKLKRFIHAEYLNDISLAGSRAKAYGEYQRNIKAAEMSRTAVEKSATAYDIAVSACRVIEAMTGEVGFAERQVRKLQKGGDI